jgi:NADH-quinone oxidoreductase subunit H
MIEARIGAMIVASADQVFVALRQWLVDFAPTSLRPIFAAVLTVIPIVIVFPVLFALTTLFERKGLARMQNRYGPNRTGPFGLLQPVADGIKSLTKEDLVPRNADKSVHLLAPIVLVVVVFLGYAVLPIGRNMIAANLDAGLLYFFAAGSIAELSVFMAGWSSRNKYSLLGAMRAIAQMISYEMPLILASVTPVMAVGSLSMVTIVEAQATYTGIWPHWFLFTPWGFAGFLLFTIAATAESNRSPFDLPEGESEIIAGYFTEYSGFKFALFFLAEYLGLFSAAGVVITLFLGGWAAPFSFLTWIPSWIWFFSKLLALIFITIWVRGTMPRLRMDQLMNFAWKFMLPMSLLNVVTEGVWRFMAPGFLRWPVCSAIVLVPYWLLSRAFLQGQHFEKRTYRFAE